MEVWQISLRFFEVYSLMGRGGSCLLRGLSVHENRKAGGRGQDGCRSWAGDPDACPAQPVEVTRSGGLLQADLRIRMQNLLQDRLAVYHDSDRLLPVDHPVADPDQRFGEMDLFDLDLLPVNAAFQR